MGNRVIEIGAAQARGQLPVWRDEDPIEEVGRDEGTVEIHQVPAPTITDHGICYQRCGGGRRVIRRTISSY